MDLITVNHVRQAHERGDVLLEDGELLLGGGTWIYSEPLIGVKGLVDLTTMGWPDAEVDDDGLTVSATCSVATFSKLTQPNPEWRAWPLLFQCSTALFASFKVWNVMTVGGNIMRSFAAAAMVSFAAGLDAEARLWQPDGTDDLEPVATMVTGNGTNTRSPQDVLRSIHIPAHSLRAHTAYRKIALSEIGRSGAVLIGRVEEDGQAVFTITAATLYPVQLRYASIPSAYELAADVHAVDAYYTDPLGTADWREQVSAVLLEEIRQELSEKVLRDGI